jgi:V8-like Glu-specific endopeptidase
VRSLRGNRGRFVRRPRAGSVLVASLAVGAVAGVAAVVADWSSPVAVAAPAAATGSPGGPVATQAISGSSATATERYWTARRMATASSQDPATGGRSLSPDVTGQTFAGVPAVGVLFFTTTSDVNHYCTASVVTSPNRDLVLTAAHCLHPAGHGSYFSNVAFVPKYNQGKAPYGIWPATRLFVGAGWIHGGNVNLDFGFLTLARVGGWRVQGRTGANSIGIHQGYPHSVNVIGYPRKANAGADQAVHCTTMERHAFGYQLVFHCGGYPGGTSGSPWLYRYSARTHTGVVIGVIGGYEQGGDTPSTSYSAIFGDYMQSLYNAAKNAG